MTANRNFARSLAGKSLANAGQKATRVFPKLFSACIFSAPLNPFLPTVLTFAVRETVVSRHNGGASGAPLKPLRDDSALRALSPETINGRSFGSESIGKW